MARGQPPHSGPENSADFAIVRQRDDFAAAISAGFAGTLVVGYATEMLPHLNTFPRTVQLTGKFEYLADGDILKIFPASKKFRTLYRRSSSHNSFLVTERCNHYCLMCSQPPKDADNSWILREMWDALPLVDKQTRSMGFTGVTPQLAGFLAGFE